MKNNLALLSTSDLEKAAARPRSREDARAIAEELADRRGKYRRDTGTMSLFGNNKKESVPADPRE